jgi:predicted transcriptional regulator
MVAMTPKPVAAGDRDKFKRLNDVRTAALEHARLARQLSAQRRALMVELIDAGYSQSDIAREMGVTRQAVQKMLTLA